MDIFDYAVKVNDLTEVQWYHKINLKTYLTLDEVMDLHRILALKNSGITCLRTGLIIVVTDQLNFSLKKKKTAWSL